MARRKVYLIRKDGTEIFAGIDDELFGVESEAGLIRKTMTDEEVKIERDDLIGELWEIDFVISRYGKLINERIKQNLYVRIGRISQLLKMMSEEDVLIIKAEEDKNA